MRALSLETINTMRALLRKTNHSAHIVIFIDNNLGWYNLISVLLKVYMIAIQLNGSTISLSCYTNIHFNHYSTMFLQHLLFL